MSEAQQAAEIERLLACEARKASPFEFLQLDIATCELTDVNRQYRKIALLLHPDKCQLLNATDAFHAAEKVHKSLSQEAVFYHLKRAFQKKQDRLAEEGTSAAGPSSSSFPFAPGPGAKRPRDGHASGAGGGAASSSPAPAARTIAFGALSQLASSGLSSDAQKAAEIRRVLQCKASDFFVILDVDPASCAVADVDRRYRKMAQALHPDKCQLPHVQEAFTVFERAHKELADEKKLVRFKVAFEQQQQKEAAAAAQRAAGGGGGAVSGAGGASAYASEDGMTAEERMQKRRLEALRSQQLEAARLGEEAARRRKLKEDAEKAEAALAAELERQRKEWNDLQLF